MIKIHVRREHRLGLAGARRPAAEWVRSIEQRFGLQAIVVREKTRDVVKFSRAGVDGEVIIAADHVELNATLGFLFWAFSQTIKNEVEKNVDTFIAQAECAAAKEPKAAPKRGAKAGSLPATQAKQTRQSTASLEKTARRARAASAKSAGPSSAAVRPTAKRSPSAESRPPAKRRPKPSTRST